MAKAPERIYEYLYVDEIRLDSYLEQIQSTPAFSKVPEWHAEFGLTKISVSFAQKAHIRPSYRHEKADSLLEYLEKHHLVSPSVEFGALRRRKDGEWFLPGRGDLFTAESKTVPFIKTTLELQKIAIPIPQVGGEATEMRVAWIHTNLEEGANHSPVGQSSISGETKSIYLLQDFTRSDALVQHPASSFYSGLVGLIWDFYEDLERSLSGIEGMKQVTRSKSTWTTDIMGRLMTEHPARMLEALGGRRVGAPRVLETLFRIRDHFASSTCGTHVFGYPIFIREAYNSAASVDREASLSGR